MSEKAITRNLSIFRPEDKELARKFEDEARRERRAISQKWLRYAEIGYRFVHGVIEKEEALEEVKA